MVQKYRISRERVLLNTSEVFFHEVVISRHFIRIKLFSAIKEENSTKTANYQRNGVLKVGTEPAIRTADPISFDQLQSIFLFPWDSTIHFPLWSTSLMYEPLTWCTMHFPNVRFICLEVRSISYKGDSFPSKYDPFTQSYDSFLFKARSSYLEVRPISLKVRSISEFCPKSPSIHALLCQWPLRNLGI